jgi:hypothetical protein
MAPDPNAPWTGPDARTMLQTHTLAHEIITRHDDPCPVLGGSELFLLQDYIADPTASNGAKILAEHGMTDHESDRAGNGAMNKNSLVGYVIAREGEGEILLNEDEKAALRQWFADGKAKERIEDWKEGRGD